jgi:hypothetical protein
MFDAFNLLVVLIKLLILLAPELTSLEFTVIVFTARQYASKELLHVVLLLTRILLHVRF